VEEEVIRPDFDSVEAEVSVPKSTMNVEVPVPVQKPVPWFAQESESAGDVDAALTSENSVPWFLQDLQERAAAEKAARATLKTEPVLADPKPAPKAETPKMPAKPVTPVVLPAPLPLSLEHELEDDLKSFEYMAQSNRILSNSISNLVDSYFRQAAQEEEPNFY
jgi:pyruvate/2-oxoglutarate dehydrogenase complex dihydrolipoamide acyltransferase (E2) component